MEAVITLKDVSVSYRVRKSFVRSESYVALKNVSFDVYKGETLGVIGHNGAGKSTLLKVLSGIYSPDSGEVTRIAKRVSLLALQAGFDLNLNGFDNVVISGMLTGFSRKEILSKIDLIYEYSELGDYFFRPIKSYSMGMRARLGFSSAVFLRPEVLLIDEVLSVGDSSFREKASEAIRGMAESEQTVVIVSHEVGVIRKLSDRVLELKSGEIVSNDRC